MLTSEVFPDDGELRGADHKLVDGGKVGGDVVEVNEGAANPDPDCHQLLGLHLTLLRTVGTL